MIKTQDTAGDKYVISHLRMGIDMNLAILIHLKRLEATFVVIWRYINKIELNWTDYYVSK